MKKKYFKAYLLLAYLFYLYSVLPLMPGACAQEENLTFQYKVLEKENEKLYEMLNEAKQEIEQFKLAPLIQASNPETQALKLRIKQLENESRLNRELSQQLSGEKGILEGQQKQSSSQIKELHNQRLALEKQNQSLSQQVVDLNSQYNKLSVDLSKLQTASGQDQRDNLVLILQERQNEIQKLRKELSEIRGKQRDLVDKIEQIGNQSDQRLKKLTQDLTVINQERERLIAQVRDMDRQNRELSDSLQGVLKELSSTEDLKNKLSMELEEKNTNPEVSAQNNVLTANLKRENERIKDEYSKLSQSIGSLRLEKKALEEQYSQVVSSLQGMDSLSKENGFLKEQLEYSNIQKSKEIEAIKKEYENKLAQLGAQLIQLHDRLAYADEQKDEQLQKNNLEKSQDIAKLERQIDENKNRSLDYMKQLEALNAQFTQLKSQREKELTQLQSQNDELNVQLRDLNSQRNVLVRQNQVLAQKYQNVQEYYDKLNSEINQTKEQSAEYARQREEWVGQLKNLDSQLASLRQQTDASEKSRKILEDENTAIKSERKNLADKLKVYEESLAQLKIQKDAQQAQKDAELKSLSDKLASTQKDLSGSQDLISRLNQDKDTLSKEQSQ
ncbi:MAG: hypothetical protein ABIG46_07945, partial [Candidatus Omnitrophota bacterium]